MSSSAIRKAALAAHPLTGAEAFAADCTIAVRFRVFNPATGGYLPLANAPVDLVCSNGFVVQGETDGAGELWEPGSTTTRLKVVGLIGFKGMKFHFEANLAGLTYDDGSGTQTPFPVASWSTKGWREPEGHRGEFSLTAALLSRPFTIGCFIDVAVQYLRTCYELGPYPPNATLKLVRANGDDWPLPVAPGGLARGVFFELHAADELEIQGYFDADALPGNIAKLSGTLKLEGAQRAFAPGRYFGFPDIVAADSIRLFANYAFTKTTLPAIVVPHGPKPKLYYQAGNAALASTYRGVPVEQRIAIHFNWFLEFVAYRNLISRAMTKLLHGSDEISWVGFADQTLEMDDGEGLASSGSATAFYGHLDIVLAPRNDVAIHELTHSFIDKYFINGSSLNYFNDLKKYSIADHSMDDYSNECFAFQEGVAEFFSTLFVPREQIFSSWPKVYRFQDDLDLSTDVPTFAFRGPGMPTASLEAGAGLSIEGAFAAGMRSVWFHCLWMKRAPFDLNDVPWIRDLVGDGRLDLAANPWLNDTNLCDKFGKLIIDAMFIAIFTAIEGNISTRRFIDELEKLATASTAWPGIWTDISAELAKYRVVNQFYVSTIASVSEPQPLFVVRAHPTDFDYCAVEFFGGPSNLSFSAAGDTVTLNGIHFPQAGMTVELADGDMQTAPIVANPPVWNSAYQVTATFTQAAIGAARGYHSLLVKVPGAEQRIVNAIKLPL